MAELGKISIRVEVDDDGVKPALSKTEDAAEKTGKKVGKSLRPEMGKAVKAATVPAIAALGAVGTAAFAAGQNAADLAETQSKVGALFGESSAQMVDWSKSAPEALGATQQEALDAASTFAVFGKNAGLAGNDLNKFTQDMTGLGADLGSFFNTETPEAIDAIGAAMRGEGEPIRRFGVMLDDATLKSTALSMGLVKASGDTTKIAQAQISARKAQESYNAAVKKYGEDSQEASDASVRMEAAQKGLDKATKGTVPQLTQQQKALAASKAIMDQTKTAQGDWARTNGGLVGQQKILSSTVKDLTTNLGTALLPIMKDVATQLVNGAKFAMDHQGALKVLLGVVAGLSAAVLVARGAMIAWEVATKTWLAISKVAGAATKIWTGIQWLWNAAMSANPVGLIVVAVAALVAAFILAYKKSDTFRAIVDGALRAVGKAFGWLWDKAKALFGWVKDHWKTIAVAISGPIGWAVAVIVKYWDKIQGGFRAVVGGIQGMWDRVKGAFAWLRDNWKKVLTILTGPVGLAVAAIVKYRDKIVGAFQAIPGKLASLGKAIINAVTAPWRSAISWLIDAWNSLDFSIDVKAPSWMGGGSWSSPDLVPDVPKPSLLQGLYTGGTVTQSGWFRVGERGPEDVLLPRGSAVVPNGGGGGTVNLTINIPPGAPDAAEIKRMVKEAVSEATREGAMKRLAMGSGAL